MGGEGGRLGIQEEKKEAVKVERDVGKEYEV